MNKIYWSLEILELQPGATKKDIKQAYRTLSKKWHPDRYRQFPEMQKEANEKLKSIIEAYNNLKNVDTSLLIKPEYDLANYDGSHYDYEGFDPLNDENERRQEYSKIKFYVLIGVIFFALSFIIGQFNNIKPNKGYFSLGSSKSDVLAVQGRPDKKDFGVWFYGDSKVEFIGDKVVTYNNVDNFLKIKADKNINTDKEYFSLGSTKDEVLAIQGVPSVVGYTHWGYGKSQVYFKEDKVSGYYNKDKNLKVFVLDIDKIWPKSFKQYISKGLTKKEVLDIMGEPTLIKNDNWYYDLSRIKFENDRVLEYFNFSDNLRVIK